MESQTDIDEILKLNCSIQDVFNKIWQGDKVVPKKIYHYGRRDDLEKDISAKTVPQKDWDKYIMGESTTWKLKKSRRGLYGTTGLASNQFYPENGWLMQISIKDECRDPSRVISLLGLSENHRFKSWLATKNKNFKNCRYQNLNGYNTADCDDLVDRFLGDSKIAVVLDHEIDKSFYIRDRACIETIHGTPDDLYQIVLQNNGLWADNCGVFNNDMLPGILMELLVQKAAPISDSEKEILTKNIKTSSINEDMKKNMISFIAADQRCDTKKLDTATKVYRQMFHDFKVPAQWFDDSSTWSGLCK
jgi:hypothetical protein